MDIDLCSDGRFVGSFCRGINPRSDHQRKETTNQVCESQEGWKNSNRSDATHSQSPRWWFCELAVLYLAIRSILSQNRRARFDPITDFDGNRQAIFIRHDQFSSGTELDHTKLLATG